MNNTAVITVNSPPTTAAAGSNQTICTTGSATLAANSPTIGTGAWTVFSGPSTSSAQFSSTTSPTATFTPAGGSGAYVLTWTISNAPCTPSTSNVTINVNAPPSTSAAGSNQSICANGSATLAANSPGIGTGAWSVQSGPSTLTTQFSSIVNPTATFTPAGGAGTYVLVWTINNAPCTASTSTVSISVTAAPTTAAAGADKTICSTGSLNLAANNPAIGTGAWSVFSGPSTSASQFANVASPTSKFTPAGGAGTYVLTWTISNSPCTPSTDNVNITVNAPPSTSVAGSNQNICSTGSAILAANSPGVGTGTWTVQSGPSTSTAQFSSTSSPTATFTPAGGAGTYVLKWTIANAPCTASSSTVDITVSTPPSTSVAGPNQSLCNVTTTTLAGNTPTVGTGAWSVVSGTATITTPSSPTSGVTGLTIGASATLRWTISNGACTPSTNDVIIAVASPPTASNAGTDQTICAGGSATLAANNATSGTGVWSVQSGPSTSTAQFSNVNSPTASFTPAGGVGAYVLTWTISNAPCTASASNVTVNVNAAPSTSVAGSDQTICLAATATLAANTPVIGTGAWSVSSGPSTSTAQFSSITSPTAIFTPAGGAGNYVLTWTISNAPCTASTSNVTITVTSPLVPSVNIGASPSSTVCAGTNVTFTATPTNGGVPSYQWKKNGSNVGTNSNTYSDNTLINGDQISVVMTSNLACVTTANATSNTIAMTINAIPATSAITGTTPVCENTNGVAYSVTNTIGSTYAWTIAGGNLATGAGTNSITVNWGVAGPGSVQVVETTSSNCVGNPVNLAVTINGSPTVSAAGTNQTICSTGSATLAANSPTIGTGTWSIFSGPSTSVSQFSSVSSPTATFTPSGGAGDYVLTWTISNAPCTASTSNVTIHVDGVPTTANAGADQGVCGSSTSLAGNSPSVGSGLWTITTGVGGSITTPASPTSAFTGTIGVSYTLRWTISNGACTASTDDVNIVFSTPPTTADAGPDQALCGSSTNLSGNTPASGSGLWAIVSGSGGSFANASSPSSSFSGTAGTTYVLSWTISNGACTPSTDNVTIKFDQSPTVAAVGSDQQVCGTSTSLTGNTPVVGSGLWSILTGTGGSVTTPTSPTSNFTGTVGTTYTLRWTISNGSCSPSTNDINITFNAAPSTSVAGSDQNLCNVTSTNLAGNAPGTGTGLWSVVSGSGSVVSPTSPTSSVVGLVSGTTLTLSWTISNGACSPSTSNVNINVAASPTTAAAGSDQTVCGPATLAANTPTVGTGAWSVVTGAGGSFSNASSATSTFTGVGGVTYTLRWTITSGTCASSTDDVDITFDVNSPTPSDAGPDQNNCGTTVTLAANTPVVGTGGWSIVSGTGGSFVDATNPTTDFSGTQGNTYTLRWTITNGACTPSTDDVVITFDLGPTTSAAGPDQTLCNTTATLAANTPTVGTGAWSVVTGSGGSFVNSADPLSGFTGTQGTAYTLRWTISNGSCTASTDDVNITFDQAPSTSDAGADQSTCSTSVTLAANTPSTGNGLWSIISGTGGSFVDATDPLTTFNGTQGTAYVLRWTISNGSCTPSTDDVNITLDQVPTTAAAGPDQTPCGPTALAANTPTVGTGGWSVVSGVGGSFRIPRALQAISLALLEQLMFYVGQSATELVQQALMMFKFNLIPIRQLPQMLALIKLSAVTRQH
ncbi:MAG: hypothetical protein QM734_15065 [Cyclobacteriaceae bacterium]